MRKRPTLSGHQVVALLLLALVGGALAGCAHPSATTKTKPTKTPTHSEGVLPPSPRAGDLPIDWNASPLVNGQPAASLAVAASDLTFTPREPAQMGPPVEILVTAPTGSTPASRVVAFVYQDPSYGRFWLIEQESQTSQTELEALASTCDPTQGCEGTWSLQPLGDGTNALSISGQQANGLFWLRNGVLFNVLGPPGTFSMTAAIKVANSI